MAEYDRVIKDQLQNGIVERVSSSTSDITGEVHYLPHHAVLRQDKTTTKVRVVYDASAKVGMGPSLNQCLHAGPPMLEHIADILLRFRVHKVAVTADIEKAFLMVGVIEDDRNVLRFLWVDDVNSECPEVITLRFTRVVFGVCSSPFLLNATIHHHLSQFQQREPAFVEALLKSLYVDDVAGGGQNDEEGLEFYVNAKTKLAAGGFNLRKFSSNSQKLMRIDGRNCSTLKSDRDEGSVSEDLDSFAKSTLNGKSGTKKVLGVQWDCIGDQLIMDIVSLFA